MVDPPYRVKNMMPGMIMMWWGSPATIPSGWHICDGTMGTPNLTSRFVRGTNNPDWVGNFGGSDSHSHPFTGDGHSHDIVLGDDLPSGSGQDDQTSSEPAIGTTDVVDGRPAYMNIVFIMKL